MKLTLVATVSCLLLVSALAGVVEPRSRRQAAPKGIIEGPSNVAFVQGPSLTLTCRVEVTGSERIQWWEYSTNSNGAMISDVNIILPGHPNNVRYALFVNQTQGTYDLYIYPTILNDGTYYQCIDANSAPPATRIWGAQVVVIDSAPNCSTTVPANGIVLEGEYHTSECLMYFKSSVGVEPLMTWSGQTPFTSALTRTNTSVWSGISFTISRTMDSKMYTCLTNFTEKGFIAPDSASNIPTYTHQFRTQQIFVHWPPKNMYSTPEQILYEIGQTITCYADAFPMPIYSWQSMKTAEWWKSPSFTIREDMVGNQTMRCHAENVINAIQYYADYFINLYVKPKPTTPTPGVSTTTTAIPAEADCSDLSGRWEATNPKAIMCLWIDPNNNGVLMGLFKNGTDTYYADIYGRAQVNTYDQGGFSAVWPGTIGITGHVLECKKCYGTEIMKVSQILRSEASVTTCGEPGVTNILPEFTFNRVTNSPPCTSSPPTYF